MLVSFLPDDIRFLLESVRIKKKKNSVYLKIKLVTRVYVQEGVASDL
jgi:hypothetical protein